MCALALTVIVLAVDALLIVKLIDVIGRGVGDRLARGIK